MMDMAFEVSVAAPYEEAMEKVIAALAEEGFGILTRIDVHDTFKAKLGVEFRKYAILGACNPPLAHKALSSRPDAGLMLPCNVIVEEVGETTLVRIVDPAAMMQAGGLAGDTTMEEVGGEAGARLNRVAQALGN